jgi:hypothetical protein
MANSYDAARYTFRCCAYAPRSDCTIASAESTTDLCLSERSVNLLSLASGDPRLALLHSLSHHLSAVDGASLIAEKTEPTSAFEAFAVFVPDRIACTAYSDCFRAAGTLQWGRHLHHAP